MARVVYGICHFWTRLEMGLCLQAHTPRVHSFLRRIKCWELVCCLLSPVTLEAQEDGIQGGGALFISDTENPSQDTSSPDTAELV